MPGIDSSRSLKERLSNERLSGMRADMGIAEGGNVGEASSSKSRSESETSLKLGLLASVAEKDEAGCMRGRRLEVVDALRLGRSVVSSHWIVWGWRRWSWRSSEEETRSTSAGRTGESEAGVEGSRSRSMGSIGLRRDIFQ
jgi:hypothetical protein